MDGTSKAGSNRALRRLMHLKAYRHTSLNDIPRSVRAPDDPGTVKSPNNGHHAVNLEPMEKASNIGD